ERERERNKKRRKKTTFFFLSSFLSWLDHGDGHVVDGLRLGGLRLHRQRELRRRDLLHLPRREQRRLRGLRQLHLVADEHEHHVGHGRPELGALLHAQQPDVEAPPRLLLRVVAGERRVHELRRLVLVPQLPCLHTFI
ncbi:Os02g0710550, partial [Oryza sativa Japonica Group]